MTQPNTPQRYVRLPGNQQIKVGAGGQAPSFNMIQYEGLWGTDMGNLYQLSTTQLSVVSPNVNSHVVPATYSYCRVQVFGSSTYIFITCGAPGTVAQPTSGSLAVFSNFAPETWRVKEGEVINVTTTLGAAVSYSLIFFR